MAVGVNEAGGNDQGANQQASEKERSSRALQLLRVVKLPVCLGERRLSDFLRCRIRLEREIRLGACDLFQ